MTTQTEALKMALEALKDNQHLVAYNERRAYVMEYNSIIEKCEEALENHIEDNLTMVAQQSNEQVEPVAWYDTEEYGNIRWASEWSLDENTPLYTHPPVPTAQPKEPEQEPVAFPDTPQTIYLQVGDECPDDAKWKELIDVCWCDEQVFDNDIVYVRADTTPYVATPLPQRPSRSDMTWVELTHQERNAIRGKYWIGMSDAVFDDIEAKLKEKNTRNGGCL